MLQGLVAALVILGVLYLAFKLIEGIFDVTFGSGAGQIVLSVGFVLLIYGFLFTVIGFILQFLFVYSYDWTREREAVDDAWRFTAILASIPPIIGVIYLFFIAIKKLFSSK